MEGRRLELAQLAENGACSPEYAQFRNRFHTEVLVTVELAVAQALDWDWSWASQVFLTYAGLNEYTRKVRKAAEKYETAMEPLRVASRRRRRIASDAFDEELARSRFMDRTPDDWDRAQRAYETAFNAFEYDQELDKSLQLEYAECKARAFAEVYIKEGDN